MGWKGRGKGKGNGMEGKRNGKGREKGRQRDGGERKGRKGKENVLTVMKISYFRPWIILCPDKRTETYWHIAVKKENYPCTTFAHAYWYCHTGFRLLQHACCLFLNTKTFHYFNQNAKPSRKLRSSTLIGILPITIRLNNIANYRRKLQSSTQLTEGSCDNIGGYFVYAVDDSDSATAETTSTESLSGTCYYDNFDCPGSLYSGQCYSGRSSTMSCPTCNNIGGDFVANEGCYYYSDDCMYLSAGEQCHTDRWHRNAC